MRWQVTSTGLSPRQVAVTSSKQFEFVPLVAGRKIFTKRNCSSHKATCHCNLSWRLVAYCVPSQLRKILAWENSRHFETPPLVSPQNDVWETTAEIPYWWPITTRILVVFVIGWSKLLTNQTHYSDLGSDASSVWNFCAGKPVSGGVAKCRLFSQATQNTWISLFYKASILKGYQLPNIHFPVFIDPE